MSCTGGTRCVPHVVTPVSTLDPRVLDDPDERTARAADRVMTRADACLVRKGLPRASSYGSDLSIEVSYPGQDAAVARCLEAARRAELTPFVAPVALLFIGRGGARADVSLDLSGGSQAQIALLAGGVLVLTLLLCALMAASVARPLRRMAGVALRTSEGDLTVRVPDQRRDEVGQVAQAFNRMADRREQLEDARRRLASDVSHELRTPLANVRGWLEAVQDGVADPDARLIDSLHEETLHLQHLVDDLHQLALGDAGALQLAPEDVDLETLLGQVAGAFAATVEAGGMTLVVDVRPGATVSADPLRLRQVIDNLVANAVRHTSPGGHVTLRGSPGVVSVVDDGEGISAADVPHVFDRFHRVDASRTRATGGSGLGLAIVRQVVEAHGGSVDLVSAPGVGTTVTLVLTTP